MKRVPRDNEATLIKSASIKLAGEGDRFLLVLFYYKDCSWNPKSTWRCCIRIDSKDRWMRLANDLRFENPAEPFNTSMIGLPDSYLLYHHKRFIKSDMARWLRKRFMKYNITTMDRFISRTIKTRTTHPFILFYDIDGERTHISNTWKIPEGRWFVGIRELKKRGRKKQIIFK